MQHRNESPYSIIIEVRSSKAKPQDSDLFIEYSISGKWMDCHRVFGSGKEDRIDLVCKRLIYLIMRKGHGYPPPKEEELDRQIACARNIMASKMAMPSTLENVYLDGISGRYKCGVEISLLKEIAKHLRKKGLEVKTGP